MWRAKWSVVQCLVKWKAYGVLFENRPALYFCNYIFITAHKTYNFWFRIKDTVYSFLLWIIIIMILILKILLHNEYKISILRYPTYVYQFLIFLIITKIECWSVFKQDPAYGMGEGRHYLPCKRGGLWCLKTGGHVVCSFWEACAAANKITQTNA